MSRFDLPIRIQSPNTPTVRDFEASFGLVADKLQSWLDAAIALVPNIVVAGLILAITFVASRLARAASHRFLERVVSGPSIQRLLSTLAGFGVLAIGVFVALSAMQLDKTVTSLLAGAGVVGLALAFAFQDLAANLIAGVYMSVQRPLAIGDVVETNDTLGTVDRIDLRNTVLRAPQGQLVSLPNREIFENKLINHSRSGEQRVDVEVGVSYGDDLDQVEQVARRAIRGLEGRVDEHDIEVYFQGFGGSSIDLVVRFWVPFRSRADVLSARSRAIRAIHAAFRDHGITIPFPIRTLDFGIEGGVPLADAWPIHASQHADALEAGSVEPS